MLRFFREYFEYDKATDVFKDKPKPSSTPRRPRRRHRPARALHPAQDKDVLRELLTTPQSFVNYATGQQAERRPRRRSPASCRSPPTTRGRRGRCRHGANGSSPRQPVELPARTRARHPHSAALAGGEQHELRQPCDPPRPVGPRAAARRHRAGPAHRRRGAGADDPHRTFRDRMSVTRRSTAGSATSAWTTSGCRSSSSTTRPLPHGRAVLDPVATEKNKDEGKPLGPVTKVRARHDRLIADSGDPTLEGRWQTRAMLTDAARAPSGSDRCSSATPSATAWGATRPSRDAATLQAGPPRLRRQRRQLEGSWSCRC